MNDLEQLLRTHMLDWRSGWSMGTFGAIAEFHQDSDEAAVIDDPGDLTRATRRGAIRINRRSLAEVRPLAYETLSPKRHRWSQSLALCLPTGKALRSARRVLTELGPDDGAIRGIDRTGILFDLGLALPQCDFCIRTSDPKLLTRLRANLGVSVFDPANSAMPAILETHPHRVALSNVGRIEVFQKIGGPDTGGVSPPGPHTHLLPKLLMSGRTHSANTPVPDGFLPLGQLHPGNPVVGPMGEERAFDLTQFVAFQQLLQLYGPADIVAAKQAVLDALAAENGPDNFVEPAGRFARSAMRLALRQQRVIALMAEDADRLRALEQWIQELDPQSFSDTEDDDAPGH